jgi:hypothetical protein
VVVNTVACHRSEEAFSVVLLRVVRTLIKGEALRKAEEVCSVASSGRRTSAPEVVNLKVVVA